MKHLIAAAALLFAGSALASPGLLTELSAFGGYSDIDAAAPDNYHGAVYGGEARVSLPYGAYVAAGYNRNDTSEHGNDLMYDEGRFGAGYQYRINPILRVGGDFDYARTRIGDGDNSETHGGYAGNLNLRFELASNTDFHAKFGYVSYDTEQSRLKGAEVLAGIAVRYFDNVYFIVDYYGQWLKHDGSHLDLSSARAGLRFDI